jgi:hypothetical protein
MGFILLQSSMMMEIYDVKNYVFYINKHTRPHERNFMGSCYIKGINAEALLTIHASAIMIIYLTDIFLSVVLLTS